MANGHRTHWGVVAQNTLSLGTRIRMTRPIHGRRVFTVSDRIGSGTSLDVWMASCAAAIRYGRRTARYVVLHR